MSNNIDWKSCYYDVTIKTSNWGYAEKLLFSMLGCTSVKSLCVKLDGLCPVVVADVIKSTKNLDVNLL